MSEANKAIMRRWWLSHERGGKPTFPTLETPGLADCFHVESLSRGDTTSTLISSGEEGGVAPALMRS
jgi:hypothetical protein